MTSAADRGTWPPIACTPAPHRSYVRDLASGSFGVHHGVIRKRPGSGPNEPGSFALEDHMELHAAPPGQG